MKKYYLIVLIACFVPVQAHPLERVWHFITNGLSLPRLGGFSLPTSNRKTALTEVPKDPLKKERWEAMEKDVARWTDALGLPIDPGIKKMIIVLNLLGFETEQSCEGHDNWGRPYPWVSFAIKSPELSQLMEKWESLKQEMYKKTQEEPAPLYRLTDSIRNISKLKILPLYTLIADFYIGRSIDPDRVLMLTPLGFDEFELYSQGGEWQEVRTDTEKAQKLTVYQQEMDAFADFLTDYFYSS